MALTIDLAAAAPHLADAEFAAWASSQTIFLSSVMGELASERRELVAALRAAGLQEVRWFEELGGRDEAAQEAYLTEVRASTIYLGLLGDEYGAMLPTGDYAGFSATHAEYLEARDSGKRISFWARDPGGAGDVREGNARKFLNDVRAFHVTGSFRSIDDLGPGVLRRLREIAVEDLAPWVKLGDIIIRGKRITAGAKSVTIEARMYDRAVLRALQQAAGHGSGQWNRTDELAISFLDESGRGRVENLDISSTSTAFADVTLTASFERSGLNQMRMGMNGLSADDVVEFSLRAALFGEELPRELSRFGLRDVEDPWAGLSALRLSEDSVASLARLLLVERLLGAGDASAIEQFRLGGLRDRKRKVELTYWEPKVYTNQPPKMRTISGERAWG
jgi:hypothetical protein